MTRTMLDGPAAGGLRPAGPAVVAQRLCDLLLSFPSAAGSGVQWQTLARKYGERYGSKLDLAALGFSTPLAAATALLWDVLRLVDAEDTDNPVVAVEDAMVMVPRPGFLGTWPSLYQTLCNIVISNGTPDGPEVTGRRGQSLLLSQLKPLLQLHWHTNFDESGLGYLSDEGTFIRLKKMKHLVQAVLRWREQRIAWRASCSPKASRVDEALLPTLECVVSQRHNDLLLRLVDSDVMQSISMDKRPQVGKHRSVSESISSDATPLKACPRELGPLSRCAADSEALRLERELAQLRAENSQLRYRNFELEQQPCFKEEMKLSIPQLCQEIFDDPFEPPPERSQCSTYNWMSMASPTTSTYAPSSEQGFSMNSGEVTPDLGYQWISHFGSGSQSVSSGQEAVCSGATTPLQTVGGFASGSATPGGVCLVPVWFHPTNFAFSLGDRGVIPCGIVQQARAFFEPAPGLPSGGFAA